MESGTGLLFDADYVTVDGRAWVRLWVKSSGRVIRVLDPTFEPYFYLVPDGPDSLERLRTAAAKLSDGNARVERATEVEVKEGLRPVHVVKVVTHHPSDVPKLRERAAQLPGAVAWREADILFRNRYLIDRQLVPMNGVTFHGEWRDKGKGEFIAERVDAAPPPKDEALRLLAFDLEVHNPKVVPDPRRDEIVIIAIARSDGKVESLESKTGDKALIEALVREIQDFDPDVLVTYNGDNFDWPYLVARAGFHGIGLNVGRDGSEPDVVQLGPSKAVRITGRAGGDLYKIAQRDLPDVKVKTLKNVAEHLKVKLKSERVMIPKEEIWRYWDDPEKRRTLVAYARDDVTSTLDLAAKLLPMQVELARLIRQPLDEVVGMGRGRQVEWFLLSEAHQLGLIAPNKQFSEDEAYEGGVVLDPKPGIYDDVVVLDFSAMYPSIMISYNISPDTVLLPGEDAPHFTAPEVGYRFRKEPDGFFKKILQRLVDDRRSIKADMKKAAPDSAEHAYLDIRQKTVKVLTNSFYGYTGWSAARWYKRECADGTAAWGRSLIMRVVDKAKARGINVIYGDTDSLFVTNTPDIDKFAADVNAELPLELDRQEEFESILFTGAKKRYAGLTKKGALVVKGLEVRRGDWCELAQRIQEECLERVLRDRDPGAAAKFVKETIERLRAGSFSLEEVTIHKGLTMALGSYKTKGAHVLAVERAIAENPGYKPQLGAKVSYVIVKPAAGEKSSSKAKTPGDSLLRDRARLVDFLKKGEEPDPEYYVEKQVLPAALRILEQFGYDAEALRGGALGARPAAKKQQSLEEWF